jgi:hypothetical protein
MNELENVVAAVDRKLSIKRRRQIAPVLNEIETLLIKHPKVFYGGMAQNMYLPKSKQFYNDTDLPDYDVYSSSAQKFAVKVADHLNNAGYDVEVRCAMHKGTYKVYWDFQSVLDITDVSKSENALLLKRSTRTRNNIRLCPLSLIKANAYLELSQPDTAHFRWTKVYTRLRLLEENKPLLRATQKTGVFSNSSVDALNTMVRMGLELTNRLKIPVAGVHAIRHYLNLSSNPRSTLPKLARLQVVSTDPKQHIKQYKALLKPFRTRIYTTNANNTFCPRKKNIDVEIQGKWYRFLSIHDGNDRCVAIKTVNETRFVSVFYCIYMGYYHQYKYPRFDKTWLKQLIDGVSISDFEVECYGNAKTVYNIKREKSKQTQWSYS